MSQDGAHLGYGMEAAMRGAIGGEEPPKRMDVNEMREYIESAPDQPQTYDECGRACAKAVLHFMMRHPEVGTMPADSNLEWPKKADGSMDWHAKPTVTQEGVYDAIERLEPSLRSTPAFDGLSGFQWGWAVNAARRCLELPPVANPAIVEIGGNR